MKNALRNTLLGVSALTACAFSNAYATYTYTGCGTPSAPSCTNFTWTFDSASTINGVPSTSSGTTVTSSATGWHSSSSNSVMSQVNPLSSYGSGGLGVTTADDKGTASGYTGTTFGGTHGVDNKKVVNAYANGYTTVSSGNDMIIFAFDKPITLTEVTFGYVNGDADFQLFAYSGVGDADGNPLNNAFEYNSSDNETTTDSSKALTNLGWDLLGNYSASNTANVGTNVSAQTTGKASKYWAVGAYSSAVAGGATVGSVDGYDDAFKLLKLCGDLYTPGDGGTVPEPGTLGLLGLGLLGAGMRRRRAK